MKSISYRKALTGAFALGSCFSRFHDNNIGVLLPNVSAAVILFMGLQLVRKVPAFLNYASGEAPLKHMMELADINVVVTSREFLRRIPLGEKAFEGKKLVFLEDVRTGLGLADKLKAAVKSRSPSLGCRPLPGEENETAVILFTSGSEGKPKGVALSHENIIANIYQCLAMIDINDTDYLLNALPIFHSFGLTAGTLMPLFANAKVFLYVSPLHYRVVPEIAYRENCTIFVGTNVFLNGYRKKANPFDFRTMRYIYCGAEALLDQVFDAYAKKFGKRVLSGYGATECSPVISVNNALEHEYGSVGKIVPGMEYKIVPVAGLSDEEGRKGLLYVKGKNVMKGYLKNDSANRKYLVEDNGWYDTGDVVEVAPAGFIRIIGRRKRFAKVSGEMISLTAIEEALAFELGERKEAAVIAVPDEMRGEEIIAVANSPDITLKMLREILRKKGFSEIARPRSIRYVARIPKLATGKPDYTALNNLLQKEPEESSVI